MATRPDLELTLISKFLIKVENEIVVFDLGHANSQT
jgi:hypothetical protein